MVQLTRIYTKGGDKGKTSLGSGKRVPKHHPYMEAIGAVDEVNAWVGLCVLRAPQEMQEIFARIQNDLFDVGADLCMDDLTQQDVLRIRQPQVTWLENQIDHFNADLAPLNSFVLPGGSELSAFLHGARTVTRRAERHVVSLKEEADCSDLVLMYLNRLSDLFFVLSRFFNDKGEKDVLWKPGASQQ